MNNAIKNTQLAYIAGYIDGDGCFDIRKEISKDRVSPKYPAKIIITSVNPEILYWLNDILGGSVQHKMHTKPTQQKSLYYFHLRKERSLPFTQTIIPYLVDKAEEAKVFIGFIQGKTTEDKNSFIEQMKVIKNFTNLVSKEHKQEFEVLRNTIQPSQEDFAYLAGFIDAECCFKISKYKPKYKPNYTYKIALQCNNTKAPVFKWLLQRFGGFINFVDRSKYPNNRNQLVWVLSSASLANILSKIHPFLRHKKPVCEELIKFYATTLPNGGARHTDQFRESYSKIIEERERIVHEVHRLNKKGISHLSG